MKHKWYKRRNLRYWKISFCSIINYCYDRVSAIISDIVSSGFELINIKSKDFDLFTDKCFVSDGSIMSLVVGDIVIKYKNDNKKFAEVVIKLMKVIGSNFQNYVFGGHFYEW